MSKKAFMIPRIVMSGWGGDVIETGLGTAGDTPDVSLCDWNTWREIYQTDINNDTKIDYYDYYLWWDSHGFTQEQWNEWNVGNDEVIEFWNQMHQQQP